METTQSNNISNSSISSNLSTLDSVALVLFKSELDRWLTFTYLALTLPVALIANTTAIVLFAIRSKYKRPVHIILVTLCFLDITIVLATLPWKLFVTWSNSIDVLDYAPCTVNVVFSSTAQLSCYHVLTLLAVEQYYFFCRPYAYEERFTVKRMILSVAFSIAVTGSLIVLHISVNGNPIIHSPATLTCHMRGTSQAAAAIGLFAYAVPEVVSMMFASIQIYKLSHSKVCLVPGTLSQVQRRSNPAISTMKVRKTIRVMLMLSGVFLLTSMPSNVVTTEKHLNYGRMYTHFDVFDPMTQFVRIANHIVQTVSPSIDPFIYLYTHRCLYIEPNRIPGR